MPQSYQGVLANIPGLGGYLAAQQHGEQQQIGQLQQMGALQGILSKARAEQMDMQMRSLLQQSGGDPEQAIQVALKTGNVAAAHALAPVVTAMQQAQLRKSLGGLTPEQLKDPETLRRLGASGLTGTAHFTAEADRLQKLADEAKAVETFRGTPTEVPVMRGNAPTEAAALAAVQQAEARGQPGTVYVGNEPAPPSNLPPTVQKREGGLFSGLMQSPVPEIAAQAKTLQKQLESAGPSIPAQYWQSRQSALADRETALLHRPAEPLQAYIDPATGRSRLGNRAEAYGQAPPSAMNQGDVINPDNAHLHGEEYIKTLQPGMQNVVRGLIEYKLPITALSSRTGERKALFEHAAQADPNFNVAKYTQRQKVMLDFTSGTVANNLTALDQALNHMGTLDQLATALKNGDIPAANAIGNEWAKQTGKPQPGNFRVAQQAVATELMRVFRQVNASEQETQQWMKEFPLNGSPDQIKGAIGVGAKLLEGRVNALNTRWNNGMDVDTGYPKLMSSQAKATLDKFTGKPGGGATEYIERRQTADGRILGKKADGTIEEIK